MYKIFIEDKPLVLVDSEENELDYFPFELKEKLDLHKLKALLSDPRVSGSVWAAKNTDFAFRRLTNYCDYLQAAGGLISHKNKLFFIYRNSTWDLPKGKMEEGEEPEFTARREIQEETGLSRLQLLGYAGDTYHIYDHPKKKGELVLKRTFWYNYKLTKEEEVILEAEEGIENYKWADKIAIPSLFKNAYGSIQEVVRKNVAIHLPKASLLKI